MFPNFTHGALQTLLSLFPPLQPMCAGGTSCTFGGERSLVRVFSVGSASSSKRPRLRPSAPRVTRQDEHPGSARTQAVVSGPAETVQCGEKGGRTDTGEGPEWRPVHQFLHHPHSGPPRRSSWRRRQPRNLGQENRLSAVGHWLRGGPGQCVEISLLVLQKRRR